MSSTGSTSTRSACTWRTAEHRCRCSPPRPTGSAANTSGSKASDPSTGQRWSGRRAKLRGGSSKARLKCRLSGFYLSVNGAESVFVAKRGSLVTHSLFRHKMVSIATRSAWQSEIEVDVVLLFSERSPCAFRDTLSWELTGNELLFFSAPRYLR